MRAGGLFVLALTVLSPRAGEAIGGPLEAERINGAMYRVELPADPIRHVPRNHATKGLVAGTVFGSLLGVIVSRAVLDEDPVWELTLNGPPGHRRGTDADRRTIAVSGVLTAAAGAFVGRSLGRESVFWEEVPWSKDGFRRASSIDGALEDLRLAWQDRREGLVSGAGHASR
jgi:hypothetical protein